MPSPLAHLAAGYAVTHVAWRASGRRPDARGSAVVLAWAAVLSLLPDLDSVLGIALGDFGRFHNNASHSLFVGIAVAVVAGGLAAASGRVRFRTAFALTLVCYELHVVMDYWTVGRWVMVLWPWTAERFSPPFPLFYGLRWSDGLLSARHLWTILTETAFVAVVVLAARRWMPATARVEA
jgi:membrane-bound metal-dependent hydrolase YbcI (DUF457 family)